MDEIITISKLLRDFNKIQLDLSSIIGRPGTRGHLGEYIASKIFNIELEESASQRGIDGKFTAGSLTGGTVNIKWYGKQDGLLAIDPDSVPDYYLVLTGSKSPAMSSRGQERPYIIKFVYIFDGPDLVRKLKKRHIKFSVATSVRQEYWSEAEIYPISRSRLFKISIDQRTYLDMFNS